MKATISGPMDAGQGWNALRHWRRNSGVDGSDDVETGEDFAGSHLAVGDEDENSTLLLVEFSWLRVQLGVDAIAAGMVGIDVQGGG